MEPSTVILYAGLVPGIIVGGGLLCAWSLWRVLVRRRGRGGEPAARAGPVWVLPILVGMALIPIDLARDPRVQAWPKETTERFPHVIVAVCLFALFDAAVRAPLWMSAILRVPLFGAVAWAILEPLARTGDASPTGLWLLVAGLGAAQSIVSVAIDWSARRTPAWMTSGILLVAVAPVAAISLVQAHVAQGAFQTGAVIAVLVAVSVAQLIVRPIGIERALAVPVVGVLGAVLFVARWFGGTWGASGWTPGVPIAALALLMLAPIGAAVAALPRIRDRHALVRLGLGGSFAAICTAGAAWLTHSSIPPKPPPSDDPYAEFYDAP